MGGKRTTPQAAAIYCRISQDKAGEGLGVERQETLCRKLAADKGWAVADVYVDNDRSAYNGKARPNYSRMLADIEAGHVDAVLCVDLDRLTRRPAELEAFMELAERYGVALANVSGDTDLSTSDGRLKARIMGAVARQESEKKGERVARAAEQAARNGDAQWARRAFGYSNERAIIPAEAAAIRDAARRVLAGESLAAIARSWNDAGLTTPQGAAHGWAANTVGIVLRNPRLAGLRAYKGEIVAEGNWDAILDRATFENLQARIRRTARVGRPTQSLLAGIARCGRCGGPLWTGWRKNRHGEKVPRYACVSRPGARGCGKLGVVGPPLDALVTDTVLTALAGPELAKARRRAAGKDKDMAHAAGDLAAAEAKLEDLAADYAAETLTKREWLAARETLTARIDKAHRALDRDAGPLTRLPGSAKVLREAWEAETIEWRRALLGAVVEAVTVAPSGPSKRFDPERVALAWKV